jgi:hypothetical protein
MDRPSSSQENDSQIIRHSVVAIPDISTSQQIFNTSIGNINEKVTTEEYK